MSGEPSVVWDPAMGVLDPTALEGFDAVVHLAGENISGRWTAKKKAEIRESRIQSTRLLSEELARLSRPPRVLVSASAVGYYGNRGDESLDESSGSGNDFLAEVCRDWEAATGPAAGKGIRVVCLRFGLVLSPKGGALARMLVPFKFGLGGPIGGGMQFMSWIALDDVTRIVEFALAEPALRGSVNAVAPNAVTNREFTKALGRALHRPTFFPLPAFAVKLLFGEMGETLLLMSQRVQPARLLEGGFSFQFPRLDSALLSVLRKPCPALEP